MIQKLKRRITELEAEVRRLKPVSGPNILTSQTNRGVVRIPTAKTMRATGSTTARWA